MKSYNSYKSSEIDWIDQIPSHWSEKRIKYLFSEKPSTQNTELNSGSISFGSVVYKDDNSIPESTKLSYQEVLVGEFLVNPLNLNYDLKSLRTALSDKNVVVSQGYIVLRLEERETDQYFFKHLLRVFDVEHMKSLGSGVRQTISFNHLGTEALPLPPIKEQKAIASFLDTTTSLIDSLIEKTHSKIDLLKEKRTSLINEAVTKGLNPNVEMKDSGVEWIRDIPNHWGRLPLKYFGQVTLGKMLTSEDKGGYKLRPYLRSKNVQVEQVDISDIQQMWFTDSELDKLRLKRGDLLLNEGGDVGRTCIWLNELEECYIQNSVNRVRFDGDNERYFLYLSTLYHSVGYYDSLVNRVSIPHLTKEKLGAIEFLRPPLLEQERIVEYLDGETQKIDSLISKEVVKFNLLKEYRQSVISTVVTGKIKVTEDA